MAVYEYFELIRKELSEGNEEFLKRFKDKSCQMCSIEFISIAFADFLIEDMDFILKNFQLNGNRRFASIVFRSMVEQIALYGYLIENPDLISAYLAGSDNEVKLRYKGNNALISDLKKISESRWDRPSVMKMCSEIGEVESDDDKLSLYDIFCISSDSIHDAYSEALGRLINDFEKDIGNDNTNELEMTMLVLSLNVFYKSYKKALGRA